MGTYNKIVKMRLFFCFLASAYAEQTVSCNDENGAVFMTATVPKGDIQRNLADEVDGWTDDGKGNYVAEWSNFNTDAFTVVEDAERAVEGSLDGSTYRALVISTEVSSNGCKTANVDKVNVCVKTGHTLKFECAYSLETKMLNTADLTVSGSDTEKSAIGTGKLNYVLAVNKAMTIGDLATATITPKTSGLVYATVNSCSVSHDDDNNADTADAKIELFNSNMVPEKNPLGVTITTGSGKDVLDFGWTSFKWSTQKVDGSDIAEKQTLSCEIGLSLTEKDKARTWTEAQHDKTCGDFANSFDYEEEYIWYAYDDAAEDYYALYSYEVSLTKCKQLCEEHANCGGIRLTSDVFYCHLFSKENCDGTEFDNYSDYISWALV